MFYWARWSHPVRPEAGAGSRLADTSPQGTGLETRSPPIGRTRPPSRQSGSAAVDGQSWSPWQRTPAAVPSGPRPPASCQYGSRGLEPPVQRQGWREDLQFTVAGKPDHILCIDRDTLFIPKEIKDERHEELRIKGPWPSVKQRA